MVESKRVVSFTLFLVLGVQIVLLCGGQRVMAQTFVDCETTKGWIEIQMVPEWSPIGAEHFLSLIRRGFFNNPVPLFRCVDDFLCQFGYVPWEKDPSFENTIPDDVGLPAKRFKRGYISYAGNGINSRSCHLFVTLGDNVESLGTEPWETPIGFVTEKTLVSTVSKWNTDYGDMAPWGDGPDAQLIEEAGMPYLEKSFPDLDYITSCKIRGEPEKDGL